MEARKWEYRTIKLDAEGWFDRQVNFEFLDSELNRLGEEGWELVNVIYVVNNSAFTNCVIASLKRLA